MKLSLICTLFCLSAVTSLKIPKHGDKFEYDGEGQDSNDSSDEDIQELRIADDNGGGQEDPLDPLFEDDVHNVPQDLFVPGPSHPSVYVPLPISPMRQSSSEGSYNVEPMVNLLSNLSVSTSASGGGGDNRLTDSSNSNENVGLPTLQAVEDHFAAEKPNVNLSEESSSLSAPEEAPSKSTTDIMEPRPSTSSTSADNIVEPRPSTSSTNTANTMGPRPSTSSTNTANTMGPRPSTSSTNTANTMGPRPSTSYSNTAHTMEPRPSTSSTNTANTMGPRSSTSSTNTANTMGPRFSMSSTNTANTMGPRSSTSSTNTANTMGPRFSMSSTNTANTIGPKPSTRSRNTGNTIGPRPFTSFTSTANTMGPRSSTSSGYNVFQPPSFTSQGPIKFVENYFSDDEDLFKNAQVPLVDITPADIENTLASLHTTPNDPIDYPFSPNSTLELLSSSNILNVTSSTNDTSGYQSISTTLESNQTSSAANTTTDTSALNTTVSSSASDAPDDRASNATKSEQRASSPTDEDPDQDGSQDPKIYTSMNLAYSPFDAFRQVMQREKELNFTRESFLNNNFLRWIFYAEKRKNKREQNSNAKKSESDKKNHNRNSRDIQSEKENFETKKMKEKNETLEEEKNDKSLGIIRSTISIAITNKTEETKDRKSDIGEMSENDQNAETLCSEPIETMSKRLQNDNINFQGPIWHSFADENQNFKREELRISEVTSEGSIELDREIEEWVSLGRHAVGRGNHGLTLVTSYPQGVHVNHIEMYDRITAMAMFQWWNSETFTKNTGLVIAQDSTIYWYQLEGDNQLIQLWYWTLIEPINTLQIFQLDGKWKLAVSYEHRDQGSCAFAVYGLDLWQNYWFEQRLNGCESLIQANDGRYLIVIHNDRSTVFVYRYDQEQRFYINLQTISSPRVQHLSAFTAGPYSFLAIGGDSSAIFQLRGNQMIPQTLSHYLLDHAEAWLPINVGYYRNDIILLVQHRLHHDSHYSTAIEALHWDGERFTLMEHAPCTSHGDEMYGFICITDAENERGILGATVLHTVQGNIFVLLASHEFTPNMFEIKTETIELLDPVEEKVTVVQEYVQSLKEKLLKQFQVLEDVKKITWSSNHNDKLINADDMKIKELIAPAIRLQGDMKDYLKTSDGITIAGKTIDYQDLDLDVAHLFDIIKSNQLRIKKLTQKLEKAVNIKKNLPKKLKNAIVTGKIVTKGKVKITNANIKHVNNLNANRVLKHALDKPKDGKLKFSGKKVIKNLHVNNIDADVVNKFNMKNPTANQDPLVVYGDLTMEKHVEILNDVKLAEKGKMNHIDLKNDIFVAGRTPSKIDELKFESLEINDLSVDHRVNDVIFTEDGLKDFIENSSPSNVHNVFDEANVDFLTVGDSLHLETINGMKWSDLMDKVVMKTEINEIDYIRVDGKITLENDVNINYLNTLRYPHDYFKLNEGSAIEVTGAKVFESKMYVGEVDCEAYVSGVEYDKIVTLSTNQNLNNFTFYDLTVTERMNIDGEITGKELDDTLSNPLLTETNSIQSNVIFKNLIVNGTITVKEDINGTDWKELFADVVEKSFDSLTVDSTKKFEGLVTVNDGIKIQSGFINDMKIKDIITIDTDQDISATNINANVVFNNLQVKGTFDGVNISHLIENSINIFDHQSTNTELIFDDDLSVIEAKAFEVSEKLNHWRVTDLMLKDNLILHSPEFRSLHVGHLIVEGDIEKSWSLSGINLNDFELTRLSKTKRQDIIAPYTIKNCNINELYFKYLNDKTNDEVYTSLKKITDIENNLYNGNTAIRHLNVNGNLDVSFINNFDMRSLIEQAIVLNSENIVTSPITFTDPVHFKNLQINGKSYGKDFEKFLHDVVRKIDKNVKFEGRKTFVKNMNVKGDVKTKFVNDVAMSQILTSNTDQDIEGTVIIFGNVANKGNVFNQGFIKGIKMNNNVESFKYLGNNTYHLKGNIFFNSESAIHNLNVHKGLINNQYNLEDILKNVVFKSANNTFTNFMTFNKPVVFKDGIVVENIYNHIHIGRLMDDVVLLKSGNDLDTVRSPVVFVQPLQIDGTLKINNNLDGKTVEDYDLDKWNNGVYFDDQPEIPGPKYFPNHMFKRNIKMKNFKISPEGFIPSKDSQNSVANN